jgi:hypothetical protein
MAPHAAGSVPAASTSACGRGIQTSSGKMHALQVARWHGGEVSEGGEGGEGGESGEGGGLKQLSQWALVDTGAVRLWGLGPLLLPWGEPG